MRNKSDNFNVQKAARTKVWPLIEQVKAVCKKRGIPFFFSMVLSRDKNGFQYKREAITPMALSIETPNCEIYQHIMMGLPGFIALPKQNRDTSERG